MLRDKLKQDNARMSYKECFAEEPHCAVIFNNPSLGVERLWSYARAVLTDNRRSMLMQRMMQLLRIKMNGMLRRLSVNTALAYNQMRRKIVANKCTVKVLCKTPLAVHSRIVMFELVPQHRILEDFASILELILWKPVCMVPCTWAAVASIRGSLFAKPLDPLTFAVSVGFLPSTVRRSLRVLCLLCVAEVLDLYTLTTRGSGWEVRMAAVGLLLTSTAAR
jgi:hypothetical protein